MPRVWPLSILALVLSTGLALEGCAGPGGVTALTFESTDADGHPSAATNPASQVAAVTATSGSAKTTPAVPPAAKTGVADYTISPMDVIEVDVFKTPDLNKTVQVDASGMVTLPLIGDVQAGGKTTHQLETEVAAKLGAKYLQSPEVSVYVKDAQSQRITVEGAVGHPGIFPTTGRTSLMQAIALSGGLSDVADPNVLVFRQVNGKRQGAKFDYKAIRTGKMDDPILQGGDVVAVDESGAKATMRNLRDTIGVFNLFTPLAAL